MPPEAEPERTVIADDGAFARSMVLWSTRAEAWAAAENRMPRHSRTTFSMSFVERARRLGKAGILDTGRIAVHFRCAEQTVRNWRTKFPEFNAAFDEGALEADLRCTDVVFDAACGGSAPDARWWLERRNAAFRPKQDVQQSYDKNTLAALITRHEMSEDQLREQGVIEDG